MRIVTIACAGIALLALCVPASALSITTMDDEQPVTLINFVDALGLTGLAVDNNSIVYVGATPADGADFMAQSAIYSGFNTVGIGAHTDGILLTTGIGQVPLTNTAPNYFWLLAGAGSPPNTGGNDTDLQALTLVQINSINTLEFEFTVAPGVTHIEADFVFGTEEYPDSFDPANTSGFEDVFGVFLDGENVAFYDGSTPVVTKPGNEGFFNDNDFQNPTFLLEYDGITNSIHLVGMLDPNIADGGTHTIKIGIANSGDDGFDSGVFIGNLRVAGDQPDNPVVPEPTSIALLGLGLVGIGLVARKRRRS